MIKINFKVTEDEVTKINQVGDSTTGSIKQIKCTFDLDPIYTDLTCVAVFNDIKIPMIRGECYADNIPEGRCVVGVYAYSETEGTVNKRISPKPCVIVVDRGSYLEGHDPEPPTASETERFYNLINEAISSGKLKGEKGDKGDKGDTYELTAQDKRDIINQIPNASPSQRGVISVPWGCGILVDESGAAKVTYPVTDITSTTDDIKIVKHTGGSTDGRHDLTFNSEKYAKKTELPKKTSDLQNDSNFVSDENYVHTDNNYTDEEKQKLENDVATKDYVEQEIATFDFIKIVETLPEQGLPNRTYFVLKTDQQTNDLYDEYMWVNNAWEFIGTRQIEVDLTNYALKSELPQKISAFATSPQYGLVPLGNYSGLEFKASNSRVVVKGANNREITNRSNASTNDSGVLYPANIDFVVKTAMCDGKGAEWTDAEKQSARERMGAQDKLSKEQLENISAVSNKQDKVTYDLICDMTVDENNQIIGSDNRPYIEITTDLNGEAFNYQKVLINIVFPSTISTTVYPYVQIANRSGSFGNVFGYGTKNVKIINGMVERLPNTLFDCNFIFQTSDYYGNYKISTLNADKYLIQSNGITKIRFMLRQTDMTIPTGTTIKIWGIK